MVKLASRAHDNPGIVVETYAKCFCEQLPLAFNTIMFSTLIALSFIAILSVTALADGMPVLPLNPISRMEESKTTAFGSWNLVRLTDDDSLKMKLKEALCCETKPTSSKPWDFQLQFSVDRKIEKDDILLARFYARTIKAKSENGGAVATLLFESPGPLYEKSLAASFEPGREWKEYCFPFKSVNTYERGGVTVRFQLGMQEQTLEIADLMVYSYGQNYPLEKLPRTIQSYRGREQDAPWRIEAEKRIEEIRKGDIEIVVRDSKGCPVPNAKVEIKMKRHDFGWGSAVVPELILREGKDGDRYREVIANHYNRVVIENDMKWPKWLNVKNHENVLKAADWLREHHIELRGHCLVWPSWRFSPKRLRDLENDPEALRGEIDRHIEDIVSTFNGKLVDWDVINEPYDNTDFMRILGDEEMVRWFQLARTYDHNVNLYINDYAILSAVGVDKGHQDHYEKTIRFLLEKGAPVSGIGMQSHIGETATPPQRIIEILDRYARLKLPITISEHDINADDDQYKADYTRDFLTATFSHPSVVAIITWGFWEKSHWKPKGAYYREDWSITPAGLAWLDCVKKKWWTLVQGTTNQNGSFSTRGFLGDYEITVKVGDRTKTVENSISHQGVVVKIDFP